MGRAILCVLDSAGCGGAPDAGLFGDEGANTLGHIAQFCAEGRAEEGRTGPLEMPHLDALGLGAAIRLASTTPTPGLSADPVGIWGAATEVSMGKDTPSGHWELVGLPVPWNWHFFPNTDPAFSPEILTAAAIASGIGGTLANTHASGIPVISEWAEEHIQSGWPICYTSADSVFQIAAHEEHFGLERLYEMCRKMANTLHPMKVGRVIARPFLGSAEAGFSRTPNRKDFAITPPQDTLLDRVLASGHDTHCIGKISDIFAGRGVSNTYKGKDDMALFDHLLTCLDAAQDGDFIFANFVEFDSLYGHQREVSGYARALETFDARIPEIQARLRPEDLIFFTADHGNDPTWTGTDHTRERVPVVGLGPHSGPKAMGPCGFSDVGATLATHLGLEAGPSGKNLLA